MAGDLVSGSVAPGFECVRAEFERAAAGEEVPLSAQVAAWHDGRMVVDLWTGPGVTGDSLFGLHSAGKGAAHVLVARLVEEGVIDLDRTVTHYWPEFAAHGKGALLVRDLLAHRSGVVGTDAGFSMNELADDELVAERLAAERPLWRPGAAFGYHALVAAALSGEIVRRTTGESVGALFASVIGDALGVDVFFGLPESEEHRFLANEPPLMTPERRAAAAAAETADDSITGIAFNRTHPENRPVWELPTIPVIRRCGPASLGAVGSARGLARMYAAATTGVDGGEPLLSCDTTAEFGRVHSIGQDLVQRRHWQFTPGFHATSEVYPCLGQGAFGHSGAGGQQAFADTRRGLAYGYVRGRSPFPAGPGAENVRLISALVAAARAQA
jgi:CubicO group peptidase (beta-lactamase class C family)